MSEDKYRNRELTELARAMCTAVDLTGTGYADVTDTGKVASRIRVEMKRTDNGIRQEAMSRAWHLGCGIPPTRRCTGPAMFTRNVTARELDELDLPPTSLGLAADGPPWWRGGRYEPLRLLTREVYRWPDGSDRYRTRGQWVPAEEENNVRLPIDPGDEAEYPRCPDCGGVVVWAKDGGIPETRACAGPVESGDPADDDAYGGCGSRFSDSRYGAAYR